MPLAATRVTAFIDVHDKLLFYCVCAWEEDFTGYVIDYGTFPDQSLAGPLVPDSTVPDGRYPSLVAAYTVGGEWGHLGLRGL